MRILKKSDSRVDKIINIKSLKSNFRYRVSRFSFLYSFNDRYLAAHMLSYGVIEFSRQEWEAVLQIQNESVSSDFIRENGLEELVFSRYIVEESYDEVKQYDTLVFLLKTMAGKKKGFSSYTILPTTGCNARCVYCYEEGYVVKTMNTETADRLVDYICETKQDGEIKLMWFGGEPLICSDTITHICSSLKERGVQFKSKMITNASLLTPEKVRKAKEVWNLKKVQVSLDGSKSDYEDRKRYVSPEKYNYDSVLKAVSYLVDEDIKIGFRCNYDKYNTDGLMRMVDDLAERFGGKENVSLYFHVLFQQNDKDDYADQMRAIDSVCQYAEEKGLLHEHGLFSKFRTNHCMADNMEASVVITPDGKLFGCEHQPDGGTWGNIFEGVTDEKTYNELKSVKKLEEECSVCGFLPYCTSFRMKHCPDKPKYCREEKQIEIERHLRSLLRRENSGTNNNIDVSDYEEEI